MKKLILLVFLSACTGGLGEKCNRDGSCNTKNLVCKPFSVCTGEGFCAYSSNSFTCTLRSEELTDLGVR